MNYQELPTHN